MCISKIECDNALYTESMADEHNHRLARYVRYTLIILTAVFIALLIFFVVQYQALWRAQIIDMHELRTSQMLQRHAPLPVSDAGSIRAWMTFDYINKLFALPTDYLKMQLQVTDTRYPRLTIGEWAENTHGDQAILLGEVENAVRVYMAPENATGTVSMSMGVTGL